MKSIFPDITIQPTHSDLRKALGNTYDLWEKIIEFADKHFPKNQKEWFVSGVKNGWAFRIKDHKRAILYLLPRDQFFKVAFVFGQKATEELFQSTIHEEIKKDLAIATVYKEGIGIRIEIKNDRLLESINQLIEIKIKH